MEQSVSVLRIGFAEMGPGDLGLALGYTHVRRARLRRRCKRAESVCSRPARRRALRFLRSARPTTLRVRSTQVRVVPGRQEDTAKGERTYTKRAMPGW